MNITVGTIIKDNVNEYVVEELIGIGGFGFVYKAKNISDNKTYAIKTITPNFIDATTLEVFKNEINTATKISSPNVIKYIYTHDGTVFNDLPPYIIMDYANQGNLTEFINKMKPNNFLENDQLLNIMQQLSTGMKAINESLVYRDIKPDNILINDSQFLITDFGLSKVAGEMTRTMSFKGYGTLKYIAPEAWSNDKNTIQMDIYSMGIVFYEIATLQYPYKVTHVHDVSEWKNAHLFTSPVNPKSVSNNLSPTIASVILRMLEKSTSKRFDNWDEILEYLHNDSHKETERNSIVEKLISERLHKDEERHKEITKKQLRDKEINDLCNYVQYQFENEMLNPLQKYIEDFNSRYPSGDIRLTNHYRRGEKLIQSQIRLVSGEAIQIELTVIIDEDFVRSTEYRNYGRPFIKKEIKKPILNNRNVLAWGIVYAQDKRGFNIFLLEKEGDLYGEWVIMENNVSVMANPSRRRPEPFGFEFSEIEEEIQYISTMHIYRSSISKLDIEKFFEFMLRYN